MNSPFPMILIAILAVASTVWVSRFFGEVDISGLAYSLDRGPVKDTTPMPVGSQSLEEEQIQRLERYWVSAHIIYDRYRDSLYARFGEDMELVAQAMLAQAFEARDRIEGFNPSAEDIAHLVAQAKRAGIDAVKSDEFERYITGQWFKERLDD